MLGGTYYYYYYRGDNKTGATRERKKNQGPTTRTLLMSTLRIIHSLPGSAAQSDVFVVLEKSHDKVSQTHGDFVNFAKPKGAGEAEGRGGGGGGEVGKALCGYLKSYLSNILAHLRKHTHVHS